MDGDFVLIGVTRHDNTLGNDVGQAHLFDLSGNLLQTFSNPTPAEGDRFGHVAIDGNRIVIGAPSDDTQGTDVGQAYLYTAAASPDFNEDGALDCQDIDGLVVQIAAGTVNYSFDVTGDGVVDHADLDEWLAQAGAANLASGNPYLPADANLDGRVDGQDFVAWNIHKFTSTAAWCSGDFNADGAIDASDFNIWNSNKFRSSDGLSAVPEPSMGVWFFVVLVLAHVRQR